MGNQVGERQRRKGKSASFTTQFPRMHYNMGIACKTGALSVVSTHLLFSQPCDWIAVFSHARATQE
jgi:hypothetical protein